MHPINKKSKLPIKPTDKPGPQAMAVVATSAINMVQKSILNPAAVIATLKCAYDLYRHNAISLGFDEAAAVECDKLGSQLAEALRASGAIKTRSPIAMPDSGLVAPDGSALPSTLASAVAMVREQQGAEEGTEPAAPEQE